MLGGEGLSARVTLTGLAQPHATKVHADQCNVVNCTRNTPSSACDGVYAGAWPAAGSALGSSHPHAGFDPLDFHLDYGQRSYTAVVYFSDLREEEGGLLVFAEPYTSGESANLTHAIVPRCGQQLMSLFSGKGVGGGERERERRGGKRGCWSQDGRGDALGLPRQPG